MIKKVWSKNCSVTAQMRDVQFQQNRTYTCSPSPPLARLLVLVLSIVDWVSLSHSVLWRAKTDSLHMQASGVEADLSHSVMLLYLFIYLFWTPPLITNHKWCNWTLSLAFLHSLYFSPISHMWFPTYHFWGLTRSKGKFFFKAKQAKTFQVTYVTPSSWRFPLPLTFTEIAESRGNKNAWFMKHFNYAHTPHSP